jgi:hypothetical protein
MAWKGIEMDTLTVEAHIRDIEALLGGLKSHLLASAAPTTGGTRSTSAAPAPAPPAPAYAERDMTPGGAFDVDEFCDAHKISRSKLYQLWRDGTGPEWMQVDHRRLISYEAGARWRREREQAARATAG